MIAYERLLSYGNIIPLKISCNVAELKKELQSFKFESYNKTKANNPRYGLSVTSIDGDMNGLDLTSIYEHNEVAETNYDEMSFRKLTQVYYKSPETKKLVDPFVDYLGRTHYLRFDKGGYFPPHRDDRGSLEQKSFRVIVPIEGCTPPDMYFIFNEQITYLNHGYAYFMNTNLAHSAFCFTNSTMLIMNIEANVNTYKIVLDNAICR